MGEGGEWERVDHGGSEAKTVWRGDGYKRDGIIGYIMGSVKSGDGRR